MPRYFFHLYNDVETRDEEGEELPDIEAVHAEALQAALGLICHSIRRGHLDLRHRIEVKDEQGKPVLTLPFRDALTIFY